MTYILTVSNKTKDDNNNIGDIVKVQTDKPKSEQYELWDIIETESTIEEILKLIDSTCPVIKQCWYDSETNTWKELIRHPVYSVKIINGVIIHNFGTEENKLNEINK
jgi:hypothetical protein